MKKTGGVKVITGFVPIPGHPRTPDEYSELGDKFLSPLISSGELDFRPAVFDGMPVSECWLYKWLDWKGQGFSFKHSTADNPKKNSAAYHIVQHQKFEWMYLAAALDPRPDVFVWIDLGIMHVPGVTVPVILDFLRRVRNEQAISIPGCWAPGPIDDLNPCWRFCGGVIVCPRRYLFELDLGVKVSVMKHISETRNLSWEVNTLARLEQSCNMPLWWYKADHNETMFTAYPEPTHA